MTSIEHLGSPGSEDGAVTDGPVLRTSALSVRFGGVQALSDVSFAVSPGEVCGLIGPNGAGKTTLFDAIAGVRYPTSGTVHYGGVDITARSPTWRARHGIRRTFQRQQTFGWLSVEDNVLTATEWRGGGGGLVGDLLHSPTRRRRANQRRDRAREVLELFGIGDLAALPAGQLTIGRARMVEMCRAIIDEPKVLLLDEPTSGLEEAEVENLGRVVEVLRGEHRCAIVLVEHDVGFVMKHSDRVVVLNLGEVLADGPPESIRNNDAVISAYLG